MTQPTPAPNLNPAQATGVTLSAVPPKIGALTAERTKGTEAATFRIPLSVKALVQKVVHDPRLDYNGTLGHFYLQAVAARLFQLAPLFRGDQEFETWVRDMRQLDQKLQMEAPTEEFRTRLERAEDRAKSAVESRSLDYGFELLYDVVKFIDGREEPLRSAFADRVRASKPMQALCRALLEDEMYGLNDEVDRLQKFMGGAL